MAGAERYRRDAACLLVSVQQFLLCKAALQLPDAERDHQGAEQCDDDDRPPSGPEFLACHVAPRSICSRRTARSRGIEAAGQAYDAANLRRCPSNRGFLLVKVIIFVLLIAIVL